MPRPTPPAPAATPNPDIVERSRLSRQLDAARRRRFTLVVAQAAQGKTTLVASYLSSARQPGAWVHLEKKDSDAARLTELAVNGLQQAFPEERLSGFLESPTVSFGAPDDVPRYRDRLLHLLDTLPSPVVMVFDGLENLMPQCSSLALIDGLIHGDPPAGTRFIFISREMPPFRLQRLKMNRELTVLSNRDLAFNDEEIDSFFQLRNDLPLQPKQVQRIRKITGGWVGGLVLVSESLKKIDAADRTAWIDSRLPELLEGEALRYFSEEVLASQPEAVRRVLILSSLLEVVDPSILSRVAREDGTEALFRDLVRRNLFVHPVRDHRKGPLYRHNRLFRDFLVHLFRERFSEEERREMFVRAGEAYWNAGEPEQSVDHFLRAGRIERAVDGIMQTAMDLLVRGRHADLARWIDALPEKRVADDPWLRLYRALARRVSGGRQTVKELTAVLAHFTSREDVRGQMLALAYLIEAGVFLGSDPSVLIRWIHEGEALLRTWSPKPFFAYAKAMLWLQIGFGHIAGPGDLQKGLSSCQNAYLLALRIEDRTLQVNATIVSVLGMAVAGDFHKADRALERISRIGSTAAHPEYRVLQRLVGIRLAMNRGDFDQAAASLERSREDIETYGLLFVYPAFVETAGKLALYRGDYAEAERCSRHLADVAVLAANPYYRALSLQLAAMTRYFNGEFDEALRWIAEALDALPEAGGPGIYRLRFKQLEGLILFHLGEVERSTAALTEALSQLPDASSPLSSSEIHLALGLVHQAAGRYRRSEAHLQAGFSIAAEKGYSHFLVMRPADVVCACLQFAGQEDEVRQYAAGFLSILLDAMPDAEVDALLRDARTGDHSQPLAVRRALYRSRLPQIDIVTFGGFSVLKGREHPIEEGQWSGNLPKLLLKSILVHGCRDIPKEVLIEDLWPENDGKAAARSFKVALHRLRKVLEPGLSRELGSAYLHLKDNRVSLDPEMVRTDLEAFLALAKQIRHSKGRAAPEATLALCVEGAAIYGGDFLAEEPYLPWVEAKRTELRSRYLEMLNEMVELYSRMNRLPQALDCCKQILRADPSSDPACRLLMTIYQQQGMRAAALRTYETFKRHLSADLGVEPDPATTAAYQKLQRSL